jgi:hypothetical protein
MVRTRRLLRFLFWMASTGCGVIQKFPVKHRVLVAKYEGLSRAEETKLFIDINTNQRGAPAALLLDIKQLDQIKTAKENSVTPVL